MKKNKSIENGFTIIEIIIASAICISTIGIGYYLLEIALRGNKIDETQMGLNGRINDTLDFILDEVKSSKRIIDEELEIKSLNQNCVLPNEGDFLFGIKLPSQALVKSDYDPKGDNFNLNEIECPIIYSLRKNYNSSSDNYSLIRYGPQFNELGYYVSPSYINFQETVLLNGIASTNNYKKISCPKNWGDVKTIRGISFCIDEFKKAIEIQIEAFEKQNTMERMELKSIASIGGFSSIQDENQIQINSEESNNINNSIPICFGRQCCWLGICLKSNKITYLIDNSFFMNENYLHINGRIIDGNWERINNPLLISPKINGKNLFEYTINSLKQHINSLPTSSSQKMYIQIIANNGLSNYLFDNGPQELTNENKIATLSFLDNLNADAMTEINPWSDICQTLESEYTGQLIILSAWKPSSINLSNRQRCAGLDKGNFSEIINEYNQFTRSKTAIGALIIDSISLYNNFCERSKNEFDNEWLGSISGGAESECILIK